MSNPEPRAEPAATPGVRPGPLAGELFSALARAIVLATGIVVFLWFLHKITWVLLFFTLALILALALSAPVTWLEKRGVRRSVATIGLFALLMGIGIGTGWLILPPLVRDATALIDAFPHFAAQLVERVTRLLDGYPDIQEQLRIDGSTASQFVPWVLNTLRNIWYYGLSVVLALVLGLVLFGLVLYMVMDPRPLLGWYVAALPPHLRDPGVRAFTRASRMVVGWVYASVINSAMKAVPAFFFLTWIGLPGALVWSVFTFVADLVPRLGFYLMIVPPVLVALSIDAQMALWVGLFYWGLSEILGNFVSPRIQASTMDMHPAFIMFVTLAMVAAFGVLGAVIASPVAGFLKAYYDEFYLARIPPDPVQEERVEGMLTRIIPVKP